MSIDTACSSSLVGAHLACTSFLGPACPRALVAGVNLTLRAETTAVLAKAGMLAQVLPRHPSTQAASDHTTACSLDVSFLKLLHQNHNLICTPMNLDVTGVSVTFLR